MSQVAVVSGSGLESWDWQNPWTKGIGGSEISAIECASGLHAAGFQVDAFTPMAGVSVTPEGLHYRGADDFDVREAKVLINYRHLPLFDAPKPEGASWWLVAQDVDYAGEMTDERLAKIDRYICLCKTHADYTQSRYPQLRGKTYISSNGVRSAFVENFEKLKTATNPVTGETAVFPTRNPKRLLYASSPDRGLRLILENWFRIKEKVPEAELHVAYGFSNCEAIVRAMGGNDWRAGFQREMELLLEQPGITFTGRLNQLELYREWFEASVWFHPSDWAETSAITCMDAMATGCWPVTNNYWAIGENVGRVGYGDLFSGIPQKSALIRSYMLDQCSQRLLDGVPVEERREMAEKARKLYSWDNVTAQWSRWLTEDLKK